MFVGKERGGGWDLEPILRLTLAVLRLSGFFSLSDAALSHDTGSICPKLLT